MDDKMSPESSPCKVCDVVRKRYMEMTDQMVGLFESRERFRQEHPELGDDPGGYADGE